MQIRKNLLMGLLCNSFSYHGTTNHNLNKYADHDQRIFRSTPLISADNV